MLMSIQQSLPIKLFDLKFKRKFLQKQMTSDFKSSIKYNIHNETLIDDVKLIDTMVEHITKEVDHTAEAIDRQFLRSTFLKIVDEAKSVLKDEKFARAGVIVSYEEILSHMSQQIDDDIIVNRGTDFNHRMNIAIDSIMECKNLNKQSLASDNPKWQDAKEALGIALHSTLDKGYDNAIQSEIDRMRWSQSQQHNPKQAIILLILCIVTVPTIIIAIRYWSFRKVQEQSKSKIGIKKLRFQTRRRG